MRCADNTATCKVPKSDIVGKAGLCSAERLLAPSLLLQQCPTLVTAKEVGGLDRILARLILTLSENLPACMLTQMFKVE